MASPGRVEDFYRGKTITIVVGFCAGGYDAYAYLIAQHISEYLPGRPNVIVQNQTGAGSLLAEAQQSELAIGPIAGEQLERSVNEVFSLPPHLVEKLKAAVAPST